MIKIPVVNHKFKINFEHELGYRMQKNTYKSWLKKTDKSDLANSLTRCQLELTLLSSLKAAAIKENKLGEIKYIENRFQTLKERFKQFGVVPNDI